MRALVTGGAGFIGSHLVDRLLADGMEVVVIDNLTTGFKANLSAKPPIYMAIYSYLEDLIPGNWDRIPACDIVFHLAATVGVERVQKNRIQACSRNIQATDNILQWANARGIPILIASSSEVYGHRNDDQPLREDMDLHISPELRWGYAAAKLADEFAALSYHATYGLRVVITRLFNTVGPRQVGTHGMVMPRMIDAAFSDKPIQVIGGAQRRSFAWVTEVVDCLVRLMQNPAAYGQVVNVGSQNDISMRTLAVFIQREVERLKVVPTLPIEFLPYRSDWNDILYRMPDLSKLQSLIGTVPNRPILDMIEELVTSRIGIHIDLTHTIR